MTDLFLGPGATVPEVPLAAALALAGTFVGLAVRHRQGLITR
jgi:hypothetical protein